MYGEIYAPSDETQGMVIVQPNFIDTGTQAVKLYKEKTN